MSLPAPIVGVDLGPDWANNYNACLSILDQHNHSPGSGVQINQSGISLTPNATTFDSLSLNASNLFAIRSAKFANQTAPLALSTDVGSLYESGSNLYFNNGAGVPVQITSGSSIVGTAGSITGLPSGTASASYSGGTFTFQDATSTSAAINVGPVTISQQVASANAITLQSPNSLAASYPLTLPPALPSATSFLTLSPSGNLATITTVGGITGSNIAATTVTRANLAAVGQNVSISCGTFPIAGTSLLPVTNLSLTASFTGRPVVLMIQPDGTSNVGSVTGFGPAGSAPLVSIVLLRDGSIISWWGWQGNGTSTQTNYLPISLLFLDVGAAAGSHTYVVQANKSNGTAAIQNVVLLAYEL
jgi:hypothetical protein